MTVRFSPGQTILRRYWTGDRITVLNPLRVVADDIDGLRLWLPAGTPYWRALTADGRTQHEAPFEVAREGAELAQVTWTGSDVLIWVPPTQAAYSVIAKSGGFPFDGTWTNFRPDPDWRESVRPDVGWDRPRAGSGGVAGG